MLRILLLSLTIFRLGLVRSEIPKPVQIGGALIAVEQANKLQANDRQDQIAAGKDLLNTLSKLKSIDALQSIVTEVEEGRLFRIF